MGIEVEVDQKGYIICMKEDTCVKGVYAKIIADRGKWKKETCCADHT